MPKRFLRFYIGFIVLMTVILSAFPGHNGDMPLYIACMIEQETGEKEPFEATKTVLKNELTADQYKTHEYWLDHAEPGILDFYRIKPLYIQITVLFHKLGFSYVLATLLPSLIAYCCIGLITFAWAGKVLDAFPALLVSVLLMLSNAAIILPRLSTPDGLSNLLILFSLFSIYFAQHKYLTWVLLLLSILLRMDNVVTVLVILAGWKFWPSTQSHNRPGFRTWMGLSVIAVAIALMMNYFLVSDAWWLKKATYVKGLKDYCLQVMLYFKVFSASFFMGLLIFGGIVHYYAPFSRKLPQGYMLLLITAVIFVRFLFFPSLEDRFMTSFYIAATLVIAERLRSVLKPKLTS